MKRPARSVIFAMSAIFGGIVALLLTTSLQSDDSVVLQSHFLDHIVTFLIFLVAKYVLDWPDSHSNTPRHATPF